MVQHRHGKDNRLSTVFLLSDSLSCNVGLSPRNEVSVGLNLHWRESRQDRERQWRQVVRESLVRHQGAGKLSTSRFPTKDSLTRARQSARQRGKVSFFGHLEPELANQAVGDVQRNELFPVGKRRDEREIRCVQGHLFSYYVYLIFHLFCVETKRDDKKIRCAPAHT